MKIRVFCKNCGNIFEKEEQNFTKYLYFDGSTSYIISCPDCHYRVEISSNHVEQQLNNTLDNLSKGGN